MPRTRAKVTQADIARALRAVAQAKVQATIEIDPNGTIRIKLGPPDAASAEPQPNEWDEVLL
jgi:hypothetical protein